MNEERYARMTAPFRKRSEYIPALKVFNDILTAIGYIAYPVLLLMALGSDLTLFVRCIIVPGVAFIAVSLFRSFYDAPRPYEVLAIDPLIKKDTKGRSFPSRHAFSMFMIALSWISVDPRVALPLIGIACLLAVVRVIGGVHFPRDVVAGALTALVFYTIGFVLIP